ncbi:helix-turn-helix domain-containing protein [Kitasatospora sp. NPDC098663]|uniref:helix-turn-helix domain-containing protein n=1 Tax=Kitasatospora sp. NPDC098663 TaxID=3364096 RepID=UPI0037FC3746
MNGPAPWPAPTHPFAPPPAQDFRLLTIAEVAAMLRITKMTVLRLVHCGDLPAVRTGRGAWYVPRDAALDYAGTLDVARSSD